MSRAEARRIAGFHYEVEVDGHTLQIDEPEADGGTDHGPMPSRLLAASLASCTMMTLGVYADRKDWDISEVQVAVEFGGTPPPGEPTHFVIDLGLPDSFSDDQKRRLEVIAGKCPVHRILAGEIEIETRARDLQV
ncbi:MAG: OsmC family protein [Solirubrobacterales bacterium]|nr:OsmC family protein [Solirubrobacterales bacterium]MCB8970603.1 OsmC family protein [Thermoleophilales bacterium]MCO5325765.1 OsmC family protein [Solirubrobacterales bacterium]